MTEKITRQDVLNAYHNEFLTKNISAEIDIEIYREIIEKQGENAIVGEQKIQIGVGQNGDPQFGMTSIKVKNALLKREKEFEDTKRILEVIEKLNV
jgi:hypothetical protein